MATVARPVRTPPSPPSCGCGGALASGLGALLEVGLPAGGVGRRAARRPPPTGTTVIVGASVLPVAPSFAAAEAIAWRGGTIIAVGDEAEVRREAGTDATVLERDGAVVLPGFIEPHAHLLPTALLDTWHDVGPFRVDTVDGALDALRGLVDGAGDGWVLGRQFDPSLQSGPDELTTALLDTVSDEVPVAVVNASGHFAYVNTAALAAAGVDASTPDIEGSPYGRYADGTPNGVLVGQAAMLSVLARNPALRSLDIVAEGRKVARRAASMGVTTICDQGTGFLLGAGDVELFESMAGGEGLATRLRYSAYDLKGDGFDDAGLRPGAGDALVRATGWKIVSDGSNQGRTGHQREPYLGTDDVGMPYVEPDELVAKARHRAGQGWQLVIHANGDRAIDAALDALAAAGEAPGSDRRHRIEHCSLLHDEQIDRIAELGASPSFLIGHVHYWGQAFRDDILGPDRTRLLDRAASCSAAGIRWTMHSDEMVTPIGPMRCIHNAVTRSLWREPDTVLGPDERVPVEAAIRAMTIDAAWQCHSDHEVGSLEVGKLADLVVLDADPRAVEPAALADVAVLETWMDGVRTFDGR